MRSIPRFELRSALFPGYRPYQSMHKGRVFCPTFMRFLRENMNIIYRDSSSNSSLSRLFPR